MKRRGFFRRALVLVYGTVIIFAILIMAIYTIISPQLFSQKKLSDLIPKGKIIAGYIESTLRGEISTSYLVPLIGRSTSQWEATVWVVDAQGKTLIRTQQTEGRRVGRLPAKLSENMLPTVISGVPATYVGKLEDLETTSSSSYYRAHSSILEGIADPSEQEALSEEVLSDAIVAVAVPITFFGEVVGAVFMSQPMTEVMSGMQALTNTITFSLLVVALLLLPVALFFASSMSRPLASMRSVALTMAGGDLSARADEKRRDEFGELGGALNYLSSELGTTISKLAIERNRLESLINGLSEGIIAADSAGKIIITNPAVRQLFSLPDEAPDLEEAAPEIVAMFREAAASGQTVRRTLWRGEIALHISIAPLTTDEGRLDGCVGIISDVTSAERLEQTRREYVANVSHELRTPLTAMRGLIEPLRDGLIKTEDERQQTYNIVLRETMRLSRLVSDMLELSRLQSGTASLVRSRFCPKPLLDLIRETYAVYAEDYAVDFVYDVPDDLPAVVGNPDRTQQVLVALLDNAFKYTPEGGTVTLLADVRQDIVCVSVRDTGVGISESDLPHVFDRFYKADKSHHSKGTGLGLAIAYEIMKNLGETMTVASKAGEGSEFSFTLHVAESQPLLS